MLESAPISDQSIASTGHVSPNFFELFTHDAGAAHEQGASDDVLPPFFMSAAEIHAVNPLIPPVDYEHSSTVEDSTSWWAEIETGGQQGQSMVNEMAWPSAFQRVLDSMGVDLE